MLSSGSSLGDRKGWQNSYCVVAVMKNSFPPSAVFLVVPPRALPMFQGQIPQYTEQVCQPQPASSFSDATFCDKKLWLATLLQKLLQSCLQFFCRWSDVTVPLQSFTVQPLSLWNLPLPVLMSVLQHFSVFTTWLCYTYFRAARQQWNSLEGIWAGEMPRVIAIKLK